MTKAVALTYATLAGQVLVILSFSGLDRPLTKGHGCCREPEHMVEYISIAQRFADGFEKAADEMRLSAFLDDKGKAIWHFIPSPVAPPALSEPAALQLAAEQPADVGAATAHADSAEPSQSHAATGEDDAERSALIHGADARLQADPVEDGHSKGAGSAPSPEDAEAHPGEASKQGALEPAATPAAEPKQKKAKPATVAQLLSKYRTGNRK